MCGSGVACNRIHPEMEKHLSSVSAPVGNCVSIVEVAKKVTDDTAGHDDILRWLGSIAILQANRWSRQPEERSEQTLRRSGREKRRESRHTQEHET